MASFFSGAVTSSPIKSRESASDGSCQSLGHSLLSPDSSYVCYSSSSLDGAPCCCRRSPRLLTNGYYDVTEDSFSLDHDGNVSLSPCKTNVSYKENLVRVFRRRRRPRNALVGLLSDVTESCQSWLDEKVFRGVFRATQDQDQDQGHPEARTSRGAWTLVDEPYWSGLTQSTELENSCSFTYDHTEAPPPPDKVAPPPQMLIQEEIWSETCQSQESFTQSLGGLSEVPPLSAFSTNGCCPPASAEPTGLTTMKALLLFTLTVFIFAALYSRSLMWSLTLTASMFTLIASFMLLSRSGPMGEWRKAKTEDITSRNE
ncbi:transmembrane protein 71 [Genypterus blacodes]|uniref:transmembrane protein 71 n=1 Tax=Genypterus blacodes TaxID=154954 RepID=UPI003F75D9ED